MRSAAAHTANVQPEGCSTLLTGLCLACRYTYCAQTGLQIITYSSPTTPGNCQLFFKLIMDRRTAPKKLARILDIKSALPWLKFADHYERNLVLDGVNCFLHLQVCCCCCCCITFTRCCMLPVSAYSLAGTEDCAEVTKPLATYCQAQRHASFCLHACANAAMKKAVSNYNPGACRHLLFSAGLQAAFGGKREPVLHANQHGQGGSRLQAVDAKHSRANPFPHPCHP